MGERIVREDLGHKDRAEYGKLLIENLTIDLGIKKSLLYEIIGFYHSYKIFHTVCGKLSWSHYRLLIKIKDENERLFYQNKAVAGSWSFRELIKQIKVDLYSNTPKPEIEAAYQTKLPAVNAPEVFKDTYDFHFLEPSESEKEFGGPTLG